MKTTEETELKIETQFLVRLQPSGCALRFVQNICMKVLNIVTDEEATIFYNRESAEEAARDFGLQPGQYLVEESHWWADR